MKAKFKQKDDAGYDLRVYSLGKYFKTKLMALRVQSDYVDYMWATQSTRTMAFNRKESSL